MLPMYFFFFLVDSLCSFLTVFLFLSSKVLVKNLRSEQKKRLTVAVELVTNPSVLFLDEPTSGLDATEAAEIIRFVSF